jgi:hydrogenase maturation factor
MQERTGKIERKHLEDIFTQKTGAHCSNVVQGPQFGVDTAVIKINEHTGLVVASDPTSLIWELGLKESAWLSVVLTANDVATSGFLPKYAQFVLNLPSTVSDAELNLYWEYIHQFCREIGVSVTGGHTGFSNMGATTLSGGVTMFTEAVLSKVKTASLTKPGLDLVITKSSALSSAAILAKSFPQYTARRLGEKIQKELSDTFYQMSVIPEVEAISANEAVFNGVASMHDVTEGGVLGAVLELCDASNVGVIIDRNEIPLGSGQKEICKLFSIDPFRSLGAGSLLISCDKTITQQLISVLNGVNINACKIGETLSNVNERYVVCAGRKEELFYVDEDPYWKAFFNATAQNLN